MEEIIKVLALTSENLDPKAKFLGFPVKISTLFAKNIFVLFQRDIILSKQDINRPEYLILILRILGPKLKFLGLKPKKQLARASRPKRDKHVNNFKNKLLKQNIFYLCVPDEKVFSENNIFFARLPGVAFHSLLYRGKALLWQFPGGHSAFFQCRQLWNGSEAG
ncbi:hypothetical protein [Sinomicrobium sp. M5D2P9]